MNRWAESALVALGITFGSALVFAYVLEAPDTARFIGTWDSWLLYGPNQFYLDYCVHRGEMPLWNPLILCGTPFAANPQVQLFYPPNVIRSLLTFEPTPLRTHVSIALFIFFHIQAGGFGVYHLARYHGMRRPASCVAVVVFLCNWLYVLSVNTLYVWTTTVTWFPWVLLWGYRALDSTERVGSLRSALIGGLFLSLALLGGNPQIAIYLAASLFLTAVPYLLMKKADSASHRSARLRARFCRLAIVLGVIGCVGALGGSALIVSSSEFVERSTRSKDAGLEHDKPPTTEITPIGLLDIVAHANIGVGISTLILCSGLVLCKPNRTVFVYALLFYLLIDFSLGPPFPVSYVLGAALPFELSQHWYAWNLFSLPLGMLAAHGTNQLATECQSTPRKLSLGVVAVLIGTGLLALAAFADDANFARPALALLPPVILMVVLAFILGPRSLKWVSVIVPFLVFAELLLCAWTRLPARYAEEFKPYPGSLDSLRGSPQFSKSNTRRVEPFLTMNVPMYKLEASITGYDPLVLASMNMLLNGPMYERVYFRGVPGNSASSNLRFNLFLKREAWLVRQFVHGTLPDKATPFPAATTMFIENAKAITTREVSRAELGASAVSENVARVEVDVIEKPDALGTAIRVTANKLSSFHAALRIEYRANGTTFASAHATNAETGEERELYMMPVSDTAQKSAQLEWPLPDWTNMAVDIRVPTDGRAMVFEIRDSYIASDQSDEGKMIAIVDRGANHTTFRLTGLPDSRLFLFAQAHYPEWRASIDGNPTPIMVANDSLMAIEVPPGDHDVRFVYGSRRVQIFVFVMLATWLGAAGTIVALGRSRGETRPELAPC